PTLRANPYPEVTDLFCRLPLSTLFYQPEAVHLGDLLRLRRKENSARGPRRRLRVQLRRADIEGSKSDVAMNAWPPQASYPCGNFSGTSSLKCRGTKGSIGHTFMVCIHTENQNQGDFYPFVLLEISVLHEPPLGHLRYGLTDVPPQPNSPPDNVFNPGRPAKDLNTRSWTKIQPRFIE
ncbi:Uncharacterized protein ART2, partial [Atta colombica]